MKHLLALLAFFCLAIVCIFYSIYNTTHLSADLKRTLIEAAYPSNNFDQVEGYLHEARLQIHTRKDAEVYDKFREAVRLAEDLHELGYQSGIQPTNAELEQDEKESKKLFDDVRSEIGLTVFKTSWYPLFHN